MKVRNKKLVILSTVGVLVIALAVAWWGFYRPLLQWHALEDGFIEVVWQEGDATVQAFTDMMVGVEFDIFEPTLHMGNRSIALRDGVEIRDGRPYIRMRDFNILIENFLDILTADTFASVAVIQNGLYNQGTQEQNDMIHALLGGELARDRFELYFQWYNTVHELGHLITVHHGTYGPNDTEGIRHMVDEEVLVNSFAVAFWMHFGEDEKIYALEEMVNYALSNLTPPVDNMSHLDFMRQAVDEERFAEVFTFEIYGWFQFSVVRDALQNRHSLDLASLLYEMTGTESIQLPAPSSQLVYPNLGVEVAPQIVADAIYTLRNLGVSIPNAYMTFNTDPNQHSLQYPVPSVLLEAAISTGRLIPAYR